MKKIFGLVLVLPIALLVCGCDGQKEIENKEQNIKQETSIESQAQETEETIEEDIDTSNWQVYQNNDMGFELKYPNEFSLVSESDTFVRFEKDCSKLVNESLVARMTCDVEKVVSVRLAVESIEEFIESYKGDFSDEGVPLTRIINQEDYILDGILGKHLVGTTAVGIKYDYIFITKGTKNYVLAYNNGFKSHSTIISTFKFINKSKNKTQ